MGEALGRMGVRGFGRMPVVSGEDPFHVLGLIRREDIIKANDIAITRRTEMQHLMREEGLHSEEGTEFIEIVLGADDMAVGKTLQEVAGNIPTECVLVSIRRNGRVLIPRGDTVFQAGDHIVAFTRSQDAEQVHHCIRGFMRSLNANE
jgi:Trk K+ transport system NAD-binding subunit